MWTYLKTKWWWCQYCKLKIWNGKEWYFKAGRSVFLQWLVSHGSEAALYCGYKWLNPTTELSLTEEESLSASSPLTLCCTHFLFVNSMKILDIIYSISVGVFVCGGALLGRVRLDEYQCWKCFVHLFSDFCSYPRGPSECGPDEPHRGQDALHPGLAVAARVWDHSFLG